jgi:hypothetical protein
LKCQYQNPRRVSVAKNLPTASDYSLNRPGTERSLLSFESPHTVDLDILLPPVTSNGGVAGLSSDFLEGFDFDLMSHLENADPLEWTPDLNVIGNGHDAHGEEILNFDLQYSLFPTQSTKHFENGSYSSGGDEVSTKIQP